VSKAVRRWNVSGVTSIEEEERRTFSFPSLIAITHLQLSSLSVLMTSVLPRAKRRVEAVSYVAVKAFCDLW
jgi:hypothetical protein